MKKQKNYPAFGRTIEMPVDAEPVELATNGRFRGDVINRNDVCNIMGWSHTELTDHIKYHGLPCLGNKFSRSAIREWQDQPIVTKGRNISIDDFYMSHAS